MVNHLDALNAILSVRVGYIIEAEPALEEEAKNLSEFLFVINKVANEPIANHQITLDNLISAMDVDKVEKIISHLQKLILFGEEKIAAVEATNYLAKAIKPITNEEPVIEPEVEVTSATDELNISITKKVIENYNKELEKISYLLLMNLILLERVGSDQTVEELYEKRINRIKGIQTFYEKRIADLNSGSITAILFLDEKSKNSESNKKKSKKTEKAVDQDNLLNYNEEKIAKLELKKLREIEKAGRKKVVGTLRETKINYLQNRVNKLKKKQGKLVRKQRRLIIKDVMTKELDELKKVRQSLTDKTEKILNIDSEQKELDEIIHKKEDEKKVLKTELNMLMESGHDIQEDFYVVIAELNNRIKILRRKKGQLTDTKGKMINVELKEEAKLDKSDAQSEQIEKIKKVTEYQMNRLKKMPQAIISGWHAFNKEIHQEEISSKQGRSK